MQITKLISKISSFDLMLAMYTGLSISFYLAAFATHRVGIPLISDFGLYSFQPTIATIGIALSLLHLVNVRFRGSWFFLSSFLISLIYLLSYTRFGAFLPLVPLGYLFLGFIDRQNINRQKTCAQIFLSLIFIFAALHKLNGSFFEGQVFIKTSDFMYWLNCKNIFLEDLLSSDLFKALPIIVIFIEIFIAALIWLRPFFAAHLVAIFSLGLSIIHPIAFYVYLTLFPVCYFLIEEKKDHHRQNVFAWALFLYFVVIHMIFISYHSRVSDFSWGLVVVICLGLIIFHLKKGWRSERGAVCVPREFSLGAFLFAGFILIYGLSPFLGAPPPFGFSMFSSRPVETKSFSISNVELCKQIPHLFRLPTHFTGFKRHSQNGCSLHFPSEAGLRFMRNVLCTSERLRPMVETEVFCQRDLE